MALPTMVPNQYGAGTRTPVRADELFGGPIHQLRILIAGGQRDQVVSNALVATFGHAASAYIAGRNSFRFTYSIGERSLRTINQMEELRRHLGELFGHENVSVHRDDSYHLGIIISVQL